MASTDTDAGTAALSAHGLWLEVPAVRQGARLGDAPMRDDAAGQARVLVADATLHCRPGEMWCIAGPNGAGKSTLLEVLAGLRAPQRGTVAIDGRSLPDWPLSALARRRAFMPQRTHDAFGATVFDTVLLGRHPHLVGWGWESAADRRAVVAALGATGMAAFTAHDVRTLSGGERQRVALAALLVQQAPLLLCDEPLSHLDLRHQVDCLRLLRDRAAMGDMVLFVCHDLNLARAFSSHALLLDGQGTWLAGTAHDVLAPAPLSRAFRFPIVLMQDGDRTMLAPDLANDSATDR